MKKGKVVGGSLLLGYRGVNRFNKHNNQIYGDFYRSIRRGLWGYLSFDLSPEADFLPVYSLGAGVFKTFKRFEGGTSLRYMKFKNSDVYLLVPTAVIYVRDGVFHTVNLFLNPARGTFTLLNRFSFVGRRWSSFLSLSFGTSSERRRYREDFFKYSTFSFGAGAEYRLRRRWSVGASFKWEDRRGLYRRYGGEVYGRYWW